MTNVDPVGRTAPLDDRPEAFRLLRQFRAANKAAREAPMYTWTGDENIGPWDRAARLRNAVESNPTAMEILDAWGLSVEQIRLFTA